MLTQESIDKYYRVLERTRNGESRDEARAAEGMGTATFYAAKKQEEQAHPEVKVAKGKPGPRAGVKRPKPYLQEIKVEAQKPNDSIQLIIGSPQGIADVIKNLRS